MQISENIEHGVVSGLLPWYANGTLGGAEQARVARHLPSCSQCRQLLEHYRKIEQAQKMADQEPTWQPTAQGFSRILQDIDDLEITAQSTTSVNMTVKPSGMAEKWFGWLKAMPSPAYWFIGLETAALTAVVLLLVASPSRPSLESSFQTLSNERPAPTSKLPQIAIAFADDITGQEIRTLLLGVNGQLVQGPSLFGVYHVQVADIERSLASLRANPKVRLAEPVAGVDPQ
ncbi:MAG: zf-HC2 domain-containing protein [Gammaproteobacteria bacterium]